MGKDTEFPGIVARPIGNFKSKADYHYQTLRCNVDMLKIIQLGITLADENGNLAKIDGSVCTWQFNFKFSLNDDMYAQESIDLLTKSGIDFAKHADQGIDVYRFGDLLISSGLVMFDEVKWISFHSGYDFGYLVKIMSCNPLPKEESEFRSLLSKYFPALYDIKFLMKSCRTLKGGLQDIAEEMGVSRVGPQHQAGSDSLLTGNIFFEMREKFFNGKIDDAMYLYAPCSPPPNHNFVLFFTPGLTSFSLVNAPEAKYGDSTAQGSPHQTSMALEQSYTTMESRSRQPQPTTAMATRHPPPPVQPPPALPR